jgi:hypothetical protein
MSARRRASGFGRSRSSDPVEVLSQWFKDNNGDDEARKTVRAASGWCGHSFSPSDEGGCLDVGGSVIRERGSGGRGGGLAMRG